MEPLPIPTHFDPGKVGKVWKVPYQKRAAEAESWAREHNVKPAAGDSGLGICLVLIDVQNTFCTPGFELYVGGKTGAGPMDDNRRICEFIYRNLNRITRICPTMDTHQPMQIFHSIFLVNDEGKHPPPLTSISTEDVENGRWKINPLLASSVGLAEEDTKKYLEYYVRSLKQGRKFDYTVWPYHAILGGIGHALVSSVEEAIFFHSIARYSSANIQIKGKHPLTEHYSVFGPEVQKDHQDHQDRQLVARNTALIDSILGYDAVVIAGQAKSHCVAWTVSDLLDEIRNRDPNLAGKIYLMEDCTSPVVVPGKVDFIADADAAFQRFQEAGMNIVRSTTAFSDWPGIQDLAAVKG
ncbi:MAG: hypothetical protein WD490_06820 [Opitutales bacterium]